MKYLFLLIVLISVLSGCVTRYCTRIGGEYENHFICTDKEETFAEENDLSRLSGKQVPKEWTRVKIVFYPLFWYKIKNFSGRYNSGEKFKCAEPKP